MRRVSTATLLATAVLLAPIAFVPGAPARAQIGIGIGLNITIAPPALPVYEAPPLPGPGYIFTPGYWAYGPEGYYWVPGVWVQPPTVGLLWTPGYWGWNNGVYVFNAGYWGPHVGFYGGIDYGFGYTAGGFFGGEWRGGAFAYNEAAFRPGFFSGGGYHVTNVYNRTIVNNTTINRVSFNGPNGVQARPTPEQAQFVHERHVQATPAQTQHFQAAAHDRTLLASVNQGRPAVAAVARPGEFHGAGVVAAREAAAHPALPAVQRPTNAYHPALQPHAAAGEARPGIAGRPAVAGRPEIGRPEIGRPETARPDVARPEPVERSEAARRPAEAYHPAAPRAEGMARPAVAAPRPAPTPRPAAAPHPAPRAEEHKEPHR